MSGRKLIRYRYESHYIRKYLMQPLSNLLLSHHVSHFRSTWVRSMSNFKLHVPIDVLPNDAMTLKDDEFYSLVENWTSSETAQVLRIERINYINAILLHKNILASSLLSTSSLEIFWRNTCIKLDRNTDDCYVVLVSTVDQTEYLCEVFKKKQLHDAKLSTTNQWRGWRWRWK